MTIIRATSGCAIFCDKEGCDQKIIGLSHSPIEAQRAAKAFFGWRTYKDGEEWKHSCLKHVAEWRKQRPKPAH